MSKDTTKSDLRRLDAMGDEEIDDSDIPELDAGFFREARVVVPPGKKQLTIRLDADVLSWLKNQGRGYQSRINAILRAYYEAHQGDTRKKRTAARGRADTARVEGEGGGREQSAMGS